MKRKLISMVLALTMVISLLPAAGLAAPGTQAEPERSAPVGIPAENPGQEPAQPAVTTATVGGYTVAVPQEPENLSVPQGEVSVTEISGDQGALTLSGGWHAVKGTVNVTDRITVTGDVNLILTDGCQLNAAQGINVSEGNSLTVWSASLGESMGAVTVPESPQGTIGGRNGINKFDQSGKRFIQSVEAGGSITINGGTVSAPAIGGGDGADMATWYTTDKEACLDATPGASGGIITVNAGHVNTGRIGGGEGGSSGTLGSGPDVASMPSGNGGDGGSITINGGTVEIARQIPDSTAKGPGWIGGGDGGVRGGSHLPQDAPPEVKAGAGGDSGSITITGGSVQIYGIIGGGKGGQAVGNVAHDGVGGEGGTIAITGGTVDVTGHIGGGPAGTNKEGNNGVIGGAGGKITISGGQVFVTSRGRITAIGSPYARQKDKGAFSTGAEGDAVIFIDDPTGIGISDQAGKENWSGVIFQKNGGILYGSPVFSQSFTIPKGYALHIFKGHTLQAAPGVVIRNQGIISNFGAIDESVTLDGDGKVWSRPESVSCYDPEMKQMKTESGEDITSYIAGTLCDLGSSDAAGWYVVRGGTEAEPILCEQRITIHGDVHILLEDGSHISVPQGIEVPQGASLTIWAESPDRKQAGHLTAGAAQGMGEYISGIGSSGHSTGAITINGGVIRACGGSRAGAIGGYMYDPLFNTSGGTTGPIHIANSVVYTHEGRQKVGIGGDYDSSACELTICGSEVHAGGTEGGFRAPANQVQAEENALIYSNTPVPTSDRSGWQCVLFEGTSGKVYGSPSLAYDINIPAGAALEIGSGQNLAMRGGAKIRNNGTIVNVGALDPEVQFDPEGVIYTPENVLSYYDPAKQSVQTHTWDENTFFLTEDLKVLGRGDGTTWYTAEYRPGDQQSVNPNRVEIHGDVNVVLQDGCDWNFPKGITVGKGNTLTVWAASKDEHRTCRLSAGGGAMPDHSAGIGGVFSYRTWQGTPIPDGVDENAASCGTINLFGGQITARGSGEYGTGIGAALFGTGGSVTIRDSHVTAAAPGKGAGIGGTYKMVEDTSGGYSAIEYEKMPDGTLHIDSDAVVFASGKTGEALSDRTHSDTWQGFLFERTGADGQQEPIPCKIYGRPTLRHSLCLTNAKLTIDPGKSLPVASGAALTLGEGGSVENNGTIAYAAGTDLGIAGNFGGRITVGDAVFGGDIRTTGLHITTVRSGEKTIYRAGDAADSRAVFVPRLSEENDSLELTNAALRTGDQPALTLKENIDLILSGYNSIQSEDTALTIVGSGAFVCSGHGALHLMSAVNAPGGITAKGVTLWTEGPVTGTVSAAEDGGLLRTDGGSTTASGKAVLPKNLTVADGSTLTVSENAALTVPEGVTLTVEAGGKLRILPGAEIINNGRIKNAGDIRNEGTITGTSVENSGTIHRIHAISAPGCTISIGGTDRTAAAFAGETVTLMPSAPAGQLHTGWQVTPDTVVIENNRFTMPDCAVTVKPVYAPKTYTLTVTASAFADVTYGNTQSAARPLTITSTGNCGTAITKVESGSTDFIIAGGGDQNITAGGTNESWTVQPAANLTAGTYTAAITVTYENGTGTAAADCEVKITVKPKSVTPQISGETSFTYTGAALVPAVSVKDGTEEIDTAEYRITYQKKSGAGWQDCDKPIQAGSYKITVSDAKTEPGDIGNYAVETVSKEFSIVDKTAPVISEIEGNPTSWQNTNAALTFTVTDEGGTGLSTVTVTGGSYDEETALTAKNGTYTVTAAKNGTYTITAADGAGNTAGETVSVTKIDKTAPTVTGVTGNPTAWTNNDVTLKVEGAADGDSGLPEKPYSFDGGHSWQAENTKTFEENTANIQIQVKDIAGNVLELPAISVTKIDKTAPVIEGVQNGAVYHTVQKVTAADLNLKEVTLNGAVQEIPFLLPGVKEETDYTIRALDEAGNETAVTVTMKPAADLSGPAEESGLGENVSVTQNAGGDYVICTGAGTPQVIPKETVNRIISDHAVRDASVVMEPFLQVEITGTETGSDGTVTQVTYDITPFVNVRIRGTGFAQDLASFAMENVEGKVTITLTLPEGFTVPDGHKIQIVHTKDDGTKYTYDARQHGDQITFENPHGFSNFTVQTVSAPVDPDPVVPDTEAGDKTDPAAPDTDTGTAQTGDTGHTGLWISIAAAALVGAVVVVILYNRKKKKDR